MHLPHYLVYQHPPPSPTTICRPPRVLLRPPSVAQYIRHRLVRPPPGGRRSSAAIVRRGRDQRLRPNEGRYVLVRPLRSERNGGRATSGRKWPRRRRSRQHAAPRPLRRPLHSSSRAIRHSICNEKI